MPLAVEVESSPLDHQGSPWSSDIFISCDNGMIQKIHPRCLVCRKCDDDSLGEIHLASHTRGKMLTWLWSDYGHGEHAKLNGPGADGARRLRQGKSCQTTYHFSVFRACRCYCVLLPTTPSPLDLRALVREHYTKDVSPASSQQAGSSSGQETSFIQMDKSLTCNRCHRTCLSSE